MIIQHNTRATAAFRYYNNTQNKLGKNLEKLSSGYKINRAADDAAGLAISEKMRAQISGLTQAKSNVKDGISLVKTAEGAMQEIQTILDRAIELATQSANGTYDDKIDREALQDEAAALMAEIDRIHEGTNFNGIPVLQGKLPVDLANPMIYTPTVEGAFMQQPFQGLCTYSEPGGCNHHGADAAAKQNVIYDFAGLSMDGIQEAALAKGFTTANNGLVYVSFEDRKLPPDAQAGIKYPYVGTFHLRSLGANDDPADHEHNVLATATIPEDTVIAAGSSYTVDFGDCGSFEIQVQADSCALSFVEKTPLLFAGAPAGPTLTMTEAPGPRTDLILQIGDSSESYDKLVVELPDMDPAAIGVEGLYLGSADSAMASLQSLKDGINYVSEARGRMGAYQNRLEHTFDNLGIMSENIQDSESTIRDVDMADEMTAYSKNNILLQAAQAMLAQANQMPQGVLQLLQ